jgi:multicomponent Na+:H+ antiporter subunit D
VSKSLILAATAEQGYLVPWLILLFASAGVFHHSGIKIPFFAFFAHDSGIRVREAPWNMLAAMAIASFLCIGIGIWPAPLYALLPYPVDFNPYTAEHVITQYQLLLFSALAFTWLMRTGLYPPELRSVNLDFDVVYRKGLPAATGAFVRTFGALDRRLRGAALGAFWRVIDQIYRHYGPGGALARSVSVSNMVLWVMIMLFGYLVISLSGSGVEFGTG